MRRPDVGARLRELHEIAGAVAAVHGVAPGRTVARAVALRTLGGFELGESLHHGILDPDVRVRSALREHCSMRRVRRIQRRVNPEGHRHLIDDKWAFADAAAERGLPVARTLGVVGGLGGGRRADGTAVPADTALRDILDGDPAQAVVLKPTTGRNGTGVRLLRRDGDLLVEEGAAAYPDELSAELARDDARFIVQEHVRDHHRLQRINPTSALQTVRIVTYATTEGRIATIVVVLKLPRRSAIVDNYEGGRTGTVQAFVDPRSGTIVEAWAPRAGGVGATPVRRHPETDLPLVGATLPLWDDTWSLAMRATTAFAPLRTFGWDIGITEDGPLIIEGNLPWDPIPLRDRGGAFRRMAGRRGPHA
jgi:hypothetical protein